MMKVALITGGTSGIGLAVAADLSKSGKWQVNIIGTHQERGQEVADSLPNTAFYQADVRVYEQLAFVFDQIFERNDRLDFVFANAGRAEPTDFYKEQPVTCIPSKPDLECVDVNLNGALYTSHLAMHYFRRSPESTKRDRNLIFTSSIGGLYPCELIPVYVATKHALIGHTRSIGKRLWAEGIKVNAICPGPVETPLLAANKELDTLFSKEFYIPLQVVTSIVAQVLSGTEMIDARGTRVGSDEMHSRALHISGKSFFFVEKPEIYDSETQIIWAAMMMIQR